MKKLFGLTLVFVMLFTLCACGGDTNDSPLTSAHSVDIAYYASVGKVPELEFALGSDPEEIMNPAQDEESHTDDVSADSAGHTHEAPTVTKSEGELSVMLNTGTSLFYYEKAKAENGISAIVCLSEAYGFKIGSQSVTTDTVKAALKKHTAEETTPTADDLFFLPDTGNEAEALIYTFNDKYKLSFFFVDGIFSAVMLSDIDNWTI